jgi:hypothetical protein
MGNAYEDFTVSMACLLTHSYAVDAIDFAYSGTFSAPSSGIHTMKLQLHLFYQEGNADLQATYT